MTENSNHNSDSDEIHIQAVYDNYFYIVEKSPRAVAFQLCSQTWIIRCLQFFSEVVQVGVFTIYNPESDIIAFATVIITCHTLLMLCQVFTKACYKLCQQCYSVQDYKILARTMSTTFVALQLFQIFMCLCLLLVQVFPVDRRFLQYINIRLYISFWAEIFNLFFEQIFFFHNHLSIVLLYQMLRSVGFVIILMVCAIKDLTTMRAFAIAKLVIEFIIAVVNMAVISLSSTAFQSYQTYIHSLSALLTIDIRIVWSLIKNGLFEILTWGSTFHIFQSLMLFIIKMNQKAFAQQALFYFMITCLVCEYSMQILQTLSNYIIINRQKLLGSRVLPLAYWTLFWIMTFSLLIVTIVVVASNKMCSHFMERILFAKIDQETKALLQQMSYHTFFTLLLPFSYFSDLVASFNDNKIIFNFYTIVGWIISFTYMLVCYYSNTNNFRFCQVIDTNIIIKFMFAIPIFFSSNKKLQGRNAYLKNELEQAKQNIIIKKSSRAEDNETRSSIMKELSGHDTSSQNQENTHLAAVFNKNVKLRNSIHFNTICDQIQVSKLEEDSTLSQPRNSQMVMRQQADGQVDSNPGANQLNLIDI